MSDLPDHSITARDVNLWYGKFQALRDVTLNIKHGLITSLIGPSGCGKTTLLRCFNRVNERYGYVTTKGEIHLLGKNIYDPDVSLIELRKSVGMVFQRPNPLPISVYENVVFGLRIHDDKGMKKSEYLVQMEAAMKKYTQEIHLTEDDVYDSEKRQPPRFVTQTAQDLDTRSSPPKARQTGERP